MPWTVADVDRHKKGLDDKQKRQWVAVANGARSRCIAKGGDPKKCDAAAIRQANGVTGTPKEAELMKFNLDELDELIASSAELEAEADFDFGEALTKNVNGVAHPAGDFLVVEDPEKVTTWHLPVKTNGKPDHGLMGAAKAALTSAGGHRGKQYGGPNKAAAVSKLKAMYKAEKMPWKESEQADFNLFESGDYLVPVQVSVSGIVFAPYQDWMRVPAEDEDSEEDLGESDRPAYNIQEARGHVLSISEAGKADNGNRRAPLDMEVVIIEPGFGNKEDNHYYSKDLLKKHSKAFEGAKMYATDHRDGEKSVRTEVSMVKAITKFSESGAPVAKVTVFDPNFAEYVRNRSDAGALDNLECSILAAGTAKPGKVDGREAMIVQEIFADPKPNVDWVTRAGAGGRALSLTENEEVSNMSGENKDKKPKPEGEGLQEGDPKPTPATLQEGDPKPETREEPETEAEAPKPLGELEVLKAINATTLPTTARERLAKGAYADAGALQEAIKAEQAYVKEISGSGKPFGQGGGSGGEARMSEEEYAKRKNAILAEAGLPIMESNQGGK